MDGGAWWAPVHGVAKSQTQLSDFTFTFHFSLSCIGEGNGNPLQCSCLENPRDRGAWWAAVYGIAQSRTRLKRRSSSSSRNNYLKFLVTTYCVLFKSWCFLIININHIKLIQFHIHGICEWAEWWAVDTWAGFSSFLTGWIQGNGFWRGEYINRRNGW